MNRIVSRPGRRSRKDHHQRPRTCLLEALEPRQFLSGDADPAFGSGGKTYTDFGGSDIASDLFVLPDGKLLAAGNSTVSGGNSTVIALARYSLDGGLDTSFGSGGKAVQPFHGDERVSDVLVANGQIYVYGFRTADFQTFNGGFVARFNLNGGLDTSFGSGGEALVPGANSIALTTDGKIIVGYTTNAGQGASDFALTRLNPNGTSDLSFGGGDGVATLNFGVDYGKETADFLQLVSIQPSGKILTAGWLETYYDGSNDIDDPGYGKSNSSLSKYALARFNPDGTLDTTFGTGGTVTQQFAVFGDGVSAAAVGPQGQVAMSGGSEYLYSYGAIFSPEGANTGKWQFGNFSYFPSDLAFQNDGKVVLVGTDTTQAVPASVVTRMTADGLIDERYFLNDEGQQFFDQTRAIAVTPDNRYVIAGASYDGTFTSSDFMLTRVNPAAPHAQHGFYGDPISLQGVAISDFDTGGEGVAFHDIDTANRGGQYRSNGPDLGYGPRSGYVLGYTAPGEWLAYTIELPTSGYYNFSAQVANPAAGGQFHFEIDGQSIGGTVNVPATGSFSDFQTVSSQAAQVSAGRHVLRLVMDRGAANGAIGNFYSLSWRANANPGQGSGLTGSYYDNIDFTGPALTRTDAAVDFNWGTGSPDSRIAADTFSVVWTGQVQAQKSETYTFYTTSDDGARLTVNGQVLIDHLVPQGDTQWSGSIALEAGKKYDIRLEYIERYGEADVHLAWSSPTTPMQAIPSSQLFPATGTPNTPPTLPGNIRVTQVTANSVTIAWDASTDDSGVSGYTVTRSAGPGGSEGFSQQLGADARSFTFTGLTANTAYTFGVLARDGAGQSSPTASIQATTQSAGSPGDGTGLFATYYDNMDFTGATTTRTDPNVDFNWGTGAPAAGIGPETFSVRWTGFVQAPASGTYTFYTNSDDGARLIVNGQTLIDRLNPQGLTEWSGAISLTAGQKVPIQADFFDRYGEAEMHLLWSGPGVARQAVPASALFPSGSTPPPTTGGDGLTGRYFDNMDFTGFSTTRIDPTVNFDWGGGVPAPGVSADTFSVRWTGKFLAEKSGTYTFSTTSDDGVRLTVNGRVLIDHLTPQSLSDWSGQIDLVAGQKYDITLEFFDRYGEAVSKLFYTPPGSTARQVVPQSVLFSS